MDEYFTELTLLPVCNCGHIIDNLYVEESIEERYGMKNVKVNFVPSLCPNCGRIFERIIYDRRLFKE